jgi:urea transport system permease protein
VLVNFGKTYFTAAFPEVWLFALGALFILVTLFLPKGILGLYGSWKTRQANRAAREDDEILPPVVKQNGTLMPTPEPQAAE